MKSLLWLVARLFTATVIMGLMLQAPESYAQKGGRSGVSIEPFGQINSVKTKVRDKEDPTKQTEVIRERKTVGLRVSLGLGRLFKLQASGGTNTLTTTTTQQDAVDEYEEIDYEKDLDMGTDDPEKEIKIKEVQKRGTASLVLDPSFSIFIMRARAGVTAVQRELTKEALGENTVTLVTPWTYKPTATVGAGIRIGAKMYFMAEYGYFFYAYPKTEPFEQEVTVSYGVSF